METKDYIEVVGTAFIKNGELLVSMSQRSAKAGRFTLVGGGVEPGETLIEAACRECEEEIGNDFKIAPHELEEVLIFREPALSDPNIIIEMHIFLAKKDVDVELIPNEEIREYRWFKLGDDESTLSSAVKDNVIPWAKLSGLMY